MRANRRAKARDRRVAQLGALHKTLTYARRLLAEERDHLLDNFCIKDPSGEPIRASMNSGERGLVQRFDRALSRIDKVLTKERGAKP